ncbi:MAG: hypothetical protein D8M59_14685 [Planctomycetes bacterium]|nr:hypothetical protein [Planctomycetota bacterium]NOG53354.1 hypothetical protein [Planctomycetota bacterium]
MLPEKACSTLTVGDRRIGSDEPPYVIAEIGVNHDGDIDRALQMVRAAAQTGADAVKLQYFTADLLLGAEAALAEYQRKAGELSPREMLQRLELGSEAMRRVPEVAHEYGMQAIVTVFSSELVPDAATMGWDAYKVGSADVINTPLLEALAAIGKPMIISTGAALPDEIAESARHFGDVFLHCVSAYPTPTESTHLAGIQALARLCTEARQAADSKKSGPTVVGYSDHTESADTGALAVAAGACVLEKHLTHDRSAAGPDHAASLEPESFTQYVKQARRAWTMRGPDRVWAQPIEDAVRSASRQSLTARHALEVGHVLTAHDIRVCRPGTGLPPGMLHEIIGHCITSPIQAGHAIRQTDIDWAEE